MSRHRRVRASLLLHGVILGATLLLAAASLLAGCAAMLAVPFLAVLCLLVFFFLPDLLELYLERRAGDAERPVDSIWFVDLDKVAEREHERFLDQTEDNPTLR